MNPTIRELIALDAVADDTEWLAAVKAIYKAAGRQLGGARESWNFLRERAARFDRAMTPAWKL